MGEKNIILITVHNYIFDGWLFMFYGASTFVADLMPDVV